MLENKYGLLLNDDIKLHRQWFIEMTNLLGINVIYRAPKPDKHYTTYTEIDANYECPKLVGCIFEEHPEQETLKKLGWMSELQEGASIIHVPYDLEHIQRGALFIVPSGIDKAQGRLFRVSKIANIMVYPASISCEIVPEYENTFSGSQLDFKRTSFNLLAEEEEDN